MADFKANQHSRGGVKRVNKGAWVGECDIAELGVAYEVEEVAGVLVHIRFIVVSL